MEIRYLSKPSHFDAPHLIYDPIRKDAIVIHYDELITLPGPFSDYAAAHRALDRLVDKSRRNNQKSE